MARRYLNAGDGPIKNDTIVTLDAQNGNLLDHWGSNLFYMPHGLEIDAEGNVWVTDVALHQVFKVFWQRFRPSIAHLSITSLFESVPQRQQSAQPDSRRGLRDWIGREPLLPADRRCRGFIGRVLCSRWLLQQADPQVRPERETPRHLQGRL